MSFRRRRLEFQTLESRDLLSADPLPVLLVLADQQHFFYREYNDTRNSILAEGIDVVVAATTTNPSTAHGNSGQGAGSGVVVPEVALANVDADDYSAIAFVGGWGSSMYQYAFNDPNLNGTTDNYYQNGFYNGDNNLNDGAMASTKVVVNNLINEFLADDKYVAGICHGTTVLAWSRVDGVSPINGRQVAVPIKDGSPQMFFNGDWYANGYVNGQYDHAVANGAMPNTANGQWGNPGITTDDVVVDGKIITGGDDFAAAYFGTVIAEQIWASMNQDPSDIALTSQTIAENAASGTAVGNLSTTDSDIGDTFTYTLVAGDGSTNNALFSIVNGILQSDATFDFETELNYSVRVRSTDAGGLFTEEAFAITVSNVNESPFNLQLSDSSIQEAQPIGTTIGNFSASDPDEGDALSYSLVAGDGSADNASFTIDGNTLKSAVIFELTEQVSFSIRVRVEDVSGLNTESIFVVQITEVNDLPVLDNSATLMLPLVARNAIDPAGIPVSSLLVNASDAETPTTVGIAITGTSGISGTWEFAVHPEFVWQPVGAASEFSSLLMENTTLIRFSPDRNITGYAGLIFRAWDGQVGTPGEKMNPANESIGFSNATETAWIPVGLRNLKYDNLGRWMLPSIKEDAVKPAATVARNMLGFLPTFFEAKARLGLAITGANGNGEWQIRTDNTWQPLGPVSELSARLLKGSASIRFMPAANWFGEASLTYRAWNMANGPASSHADVTVEAGFSPESMTAVTFVAAVNDAPLLDTSSARVFSLDPQSGGQLLAGSADIDSTVAGIAITRAHSQNGFWQYRVAATGEWSRLPKVSNGSGLILYPWSDVRFLPDLGATIARGHFEYQAWDGSTGGLPGDRINTNSTAFSKTFETATFSMGNQSPTFLAGDTPSLGSMRSNQKPQVFALSGLLIRMDDADPGSQKGLAISGFAGNGTWEFTIDAGRTWQKICNLAAGSLLLRSSDKIRFTPDVGWTGNASIDFAAWDRTTGVAGDRLAIASDAVSTEVLTAVLTVL